MKVIVMWLIITASNNTQPTKVEVGTFKTFQECNSAIENSVTSSNLPRLNRTDIFETVTLVCTRR